MQKKQVLLLLANGFELLEASAFMDVMGWNYLEGDGSTACITAGLHREVMSSFGHRFMVDKLIHDIQINDYAALAIPGGFEEYGYYEEAYSEPFLDLIRSFRAQQKWIASVCVGALPLARSGVLHRRHCTTYPNPVRVSNLQEMGGKPVLQRMVVDDRLITSQNPSTAIEVAFTLLSELTSPDNALRVKKLMGY